MSHSNIDPAEIAKFTELASHWWDPNGALKSLHDINPLRLRYIEQQVNLAAKTVIDVGCGGGILAESLAKNAAKVTAIDMSEAAIRVAKMHLLESGLQVEYLLNTAEELAIERPEQFDIVTCMELLEHVPDPLSVIKACATLAKPGGKVFFSTLNRNLKSYLFAIVGAEYLLEILPKNTHDFAKFIRPSELAAWSRKVGLKVKDMAGISYNPFAKSYSLVTDVTVNYLMCLEKL